MVRELTFTLAALCVSSAPAFAQLLEQELRPAGVAVSDRFGVSLDAEAGRFVAGALFRHDSGSAHVFQYMGGQWVEEAELVPTDGNDMDWFGDDVAMSGDTVVVGAPNHDLTVSGAGAAYVYRRTGSTWALEQKLTAATPALFAQFGSQVVIDGDRIAVAARLENPGGAVYVFERAGSTWIQTARVEPAGLQDGDYFGFDLALEGDTIIAGAFGVDGSGGGDLTGAAYVYRELAGSWTQEAILPGPTSGEVNFGYRVALDGDRVAVSAPSQCCSGPLEGVVHLFERTGSSWSQTAELRAPGGMPVDDFGRALFLDGNRLLVGAWNESMLLQLSGAIYLFEHDGVGWSPFLKWTGTELTAFDGYGESVALDGPRVLAGASGVGQPLAGGAVYSVELGADATFYCFCETGAPCNNGVGFGGCATGTGAGGLLLAYGNASVTDDELVLRVFDAAPGQWGLVAIGRATQQVPYGDGQLCIAPGTAMSLARFPPKLPDDYGVFTEGPGLVAYSLGNFPPEYQFQPGETYTFQGLFRTPHTSSCGARYNATNAVEVTFRP